MLCVCVCVLLHKNPVLFLDTRMYSGFCAVFGRHSLKHSFTARNPIRAECKSRTKNIYTHTHTHTHTTTKQSGRKVYRAINCIFIWRTWLGCKNVPFFCPEDFYSLCVRRALWSQPSARSWQPVARQPCLGGKTLSVPGKRAAGV